MFFVAGFRQKRIRGQIEVMVHQPAWEQILLLGKRQEGKILMLGSPEVRTVLIVKQRAESSWTWSVQFHAGTALV